MSDLPIQQDDKKPLELTLEQRVEILERDIREVARGTNTQAALLEFIVVSFDRIVQKYLALIRQEPKPVEVTEKPE